MKCENFNEKNAAGGNVEYMGRNHNAKIRIEKIESLVLKRENWNRKKIALKATRKCDFLKQNRVNRLKTAEKNEKQTCLKTGWLFVLKFSLFNVVAEKREVSAERVVRENFFHFFGEFLRGL